MISPRVYIDWDYDGFGAADEVTEYVEAVSGVRGLSDPLLRVADVGTCTLTLLNHDRRFSPLNAGGPYYGKLQPNLPIAVCATDGTSEWALFRGVVRRIMPEPDLWGRQRCVMVCEDAIGILQAAMIALPQWPTPLYPDAWLRLILAAAYRTGVAQGAVTLSATPAAASTVTIGLKTYRFVSALAQANDVLRGASATEAAANLRTAVNQGYGAGTAYHASTTRNELVVATGTGATVTLRGVARGAWGNGLALSMTASGSVTAFAGGEDVAGVSFEQGVSLISNASTNWRTGETNGLSAVMDVVQSEFGWFWVAGDGTLVFHDRHYTAERSAAVPDLALDDDHNLQTGSLSLDRVYNRVIVTYTPLRALVTGVVARASAPLDIPGTGGTDRWSSSDPILKGAAKTVLIPFVDPVAGQVVGARSLVQPPVPGTDYTVNDFLNKLGYDYTSSGLIRISTALTASGVEATFTNNATGTLYVFDFQYRGVAIVTYDPVQVVLDDPDSQDDFGRREYEYKLPLEIDNAAPFAQALAEYLLARYATPRYEVQSVGFAGIETVGGVDVWGLDLGDVVAASESQTGLSSQRYLITGLDFSFAPERRLPPRITFTLDPLDDFNVLVLDDPVYGLLDGPAVLGL